MTMTTKSEEERQYDRLKKRCDYLIEKIETLGKNEIINEKEIAGLLTSLHATEEIMENIVIDETMRIQEEAGGWDLTNRGVK